MSGVLLATRPPGIAPRTVPIADFDHQVAKEIRALGGEVTLLYTRRLPNEEEQRRLEDDGLPWIPWVAGRQPAARDLGRLVAILRRLRPAVSAFQFSAVPWGLCASYLAGVRHRLAWYQTAYGAILESHPRPAWRRALQLKVARGYRRLATHHLAVSRSAAGELHELFAAPRRRTFLCHQGVPLPTEETAQAPPGPPTIVCVAGLGPMKGQDTLIEAVAGLGRNDVRLVLVGPGDPAPFERLAAHHGLGERCLLTGPQSREEVYHHFATCTLAALPTRADAAPKVALEAMACGAPFLGSAVGGLFDFIEPDVSGVLVPPGDVAAWRHAITALLDDPAKRASLAAAGRRRARHFTLEVRGRHLAQALWRLASDGVFEGAAAPLPAIPTPSTPALDAPVLEAPPPAAHGR